MLDRKPGVQKMKHFYLQLTTKTVLQICQSFQYVKYSLQANATNLLNIYWRTPEVVIKFAIKHAKVIYDEPVTAFLVSVGLFFY